MWRSVEEVAATTWRRKASTSAPPAATSSTAAPLHRARQAACSLRTRFQARKRRRRRCTAPDKPPASRGAATSGMREHRSSASACSLLLSDCCYCGRRFVACGSGRTASAISLRARACVRVMPSCATFNSGAQQSSSASWNQRQGPFHARRGSACHATGCRRLGGTAAPGGHWFP